MGPGANDGLHVVQRAIGRGVVQPPLLGNGRAGAIRQPGRFRGVQGGGHGIEPFRRFGKSHAAEQTGSGPAVTVDEAVTETAVGPMCVSLI